MAFRDDQGSLINDGAVGGDLIRQPAEGVRFGLDLKATDMTVNHGDIDSAGTVIEAELFDDQSILTIPGEP